MKRSGRHSKHSKAHNKARRAKRKAARDARPALIKAVEAGYLLSIRSIAAGCG